MPSTEYGNEPLMQKIGDGEVYLANASSPVAGGGTLNLHARNPSESGSTMWVADLDVVTTGQSSEVHLIDAFDSISDGSSITIQNAEMDPQALPPDEGPFEAFKDSTFTAAADSTLTIGVSKSNQLTTSHLTSNLLLVRQGREFVVEVENTSTSEMTAIISMYLVA